MTLKLAREARERPPGVTRRDPSVIGDPNWGRPRCRLCGELFHGDEDMVRVRRFRWSNAFVHGHHTISELAKRR